MKWIGVALVIIMILVVPFNQVVAADVIEEERALYIQANPDIDYNCVLNIVNTSNNQYTNYEMLVEPFINETGISGGFSGSFLPPAKFQLNIANTSASNNHLIMGSVVEFQRKNLLSGASVSWWRSPYFFNYSYAASRDFTTTMSIYHVDLPRASNLTFYTASPGNNYPVQPQNSTHPSLIYQKTYTNCGSTKNDDQWYINKTYTLPANDTLVNPNEPYNETTNPRKYNVSFHYSHAWFNVSAPIYPNESYFVIWDISDVVMGVNDAGSVWITTSDIGNNAYGRTVIAWNDRTVYDIPLDLDSAVIFQIGMGAGITGTKLLYNNNSDYQDHTTSFNNPSFESAVFGFKSNFSNTFAVDGWTTSVSAPSEAWVVRNSVTKSADFILNNTGGQDDGAAGGNTHAWGELIFTLPSLPTEGENFKFEIDLNPVYWVFISDAHYTQLSASVKIALYDTTKERCRIILQKLTQYNSYTTPPTITYENQIKYYDSAGTWQIVNLPNALPDRFYVSIQTDTSSGDAYLHIYDAYNPQKMFFAQYIPNIYTTVHGSNQLVITGAVENPSGQLLKSNVIPTGQTVLSVRKVTGVERTNFLQWTMTTPGNRVLISKNDFLDGFETIVPEHKGKIFGQNEKAIGFMHKDASTFDANGRIDQTVALPLTNRRVYASGYFRMVYDDATKYTGASLGFQIAGLTGSGWVTDTVFYSIFDSSWHQITAGYIEGTFTQIKITIEYYFPALGPGSLDLKMGFFDNLTVYSINNASYNYHTFYQQIDNGDFNSTNYYTFMIPLRQTVDPDFEPYAILEFKDSAGTTILTRLTRPTDFYDDFIMYGISASLISILSYVKISLYNFCADAYLFLHDRNSDFNLNDAHTLMYNQFEKYDNTSTLVDRTYFSPYYTLKTTEGLWINADSYFTTSYFYYVTVRFIAFIDNDPEVLLVQFAIVGVEDIDVYRVKLTAFGKVFDDDEWKAYLDVRNRPSFLDKLVDWFINSPIGQFLQAIGKFIFNVIRFLAPLVESLIHLIIEAIVFIIAAVIYFFSTWVIWAFTKFWILVGQNRTEEGIAVLTSVTGQVTGLVGSVGGAAGGFATKLSKVGRKK